MINELEAAVSKAEELAQKADGHSIRELCAFFSHPLWPVRRKAADLLESLSREHRGPVPILQDCLASSDPDERFWAATVLASTGESSALFRLLELITDFDEDLGPLLVVMAQGCPAPFRIVAAGILSAGSEAARKWTIRALTDYLDTTLADTLADSLPRFSPELRFEAFTVLASARDGKAFKRLVNPMCRCPWPARGAGYRALFILADRPGAPEDPAAVCLASSTARDRERLAPALAAALAGSDPSAVALGAARLVGPSARAALMLSIRPTDIPLRAAIAHLTDPEPELRALSALMLGRSGLQDAVKPMLSLLSDGDPEVRLSALSAIKRIGPMWDAPPSSLGELISLGSNTESKLALDLASRVRTPALPGLLLPLASHQDYHVRARIAGLLGKTRGSEVVETLGQMLSDPFWPVRRAAASSLARIGSEALPELKSIATGRRNIDAGYWAAAALGGIGGLDAEELLFELANSEQPSLRRGAVKGLTRVKGDQALKAIEKALDDDDRSVRIQAVKALLRHQGEGAAPRLLNLASDHDPDIRYWALRILSDSRFVCETSHLEKMLEIEPLPANRTLIERLIGRCHEEAASKQSGSDPESDMQPALNTSSEDDADDCQ